MQPYYEESGIKLFHGDCREVLPSLGVCAEHLITDPPYQISGEHSDEHRQDGSLRRHNFSWDTDPACRAIDSALTLAIECLRRPANAIIWCSHKQISRFDDLLTNAGMSTKPLGWVKQCPPPSFGCTRWASGFEFALFGFDVGATWNLRTSGMRPNVFTIDSLRHGNPERVGHETQKPIRLMLETMQPVTSPGQTVLDCYAGSGTTLLAAKMLELSAIGIEQDERWCEIAANRLRQGVLFGSTA